MNSENRRCPGCGVNTNNNTQRLVVDNCGHRKCRKCLLVEESSCSQCIHQGEPTNLCTADNSGGGGAGSHYPVPYSPVRSSYSGPPCNAPPPLAHSGSGYFGFHHAPVDRLQSLPTIASIHTVIPDEEISSLNEDFEDDDSSLLAGQEELEEAAIRGKEEITARHSRTRVETYLTAETPQSHGEVSGQRQSVIRLTPFSRTPPVSSSVQPFNLPTHQAPHPPPPLPLPPRPPCSPPETGPSCYRPEPEWRVQHCGPAQGQKPVELTKAPTRVEEDSQHNSVKSEKALDPELDDTRKSRLTNWVLNEHLSFKGDQDTDDIESLISNQKEDAVDVIRRGEEVSKNFISEIKSALDVENFQPVPEHIVLKCLAKDKTVYHCTVCRKNIKHTTFRHHLNCPSRGKIFACDSCPRTFKTSSHLTYHTRSAHTGERPFQCDQCEKSFFQVVKLKRHLLVHSGERPFSCDLCTKSFRTNYHLKEHRNIHTTETHHQCVICSRTFADSNNYRRHIKSMHNQNAAGTSVTTKNDRRKIRRPVEGLSSETQGRTGSGENLRQETGNIPQSDSVNGHLGAGNRRGKTSSQIQNRNSDDMTNSVVTADQNKETTKPVSPEKFDMWSSSKQTVEMDPRSVGRKDKNEKYEGDLRDEAEQARCYLAEAALPNLDATTDSAFLEEIEDDPSEMVEASMETEETVTVSVRVGRDEQDMTAAAGEDGYSTVCSREQEENISGVNELSLLTKTPVSSPPSRTDGGVGMALENSVSAGLTKGAGGERSGGVCGVGGGSSRMSNILVPSINHLDSVLVNMEDTNDIPSQLPLDHILPDLSEQEKFVLKQIYVANKIDIGDLMESDLAATAPTQPRALNTPATCPPRAVPTTTKLAKKSFLSRYRKQSGIVAATDAAATTGNTSSTSSLATAVPETANVSSIDRVASVRPLDAAPAPGSDTAGTGNFSDDVDVARKVVSDATKTLLSSGSVHIDLDSDQREAFLRSMAKILSSVSKGQANKPV